LQRDTAAAEHLVAPGGSRQFPPGSATGADAARSAHPDVARRRRAVHPGGGGRSVLPDLRAAAAVRPAQVRPAAARRTLPARSLVHAGRAGLAPDAGAAPGRRREPAGHRRGEAEIGANRAARDAPRRADLSQVLDEARTQLSRQLLWINFGAFAALVIGGFVLVWLGLSPLKRLSDAVSKVSEKDFHLPIDQNKLPRELKPIAGRLAETLDQL